METLLEILEELHPDIDFESCDSLIDANILDSFDIIALISQISLEFGVSIPPDEIIPENFNSAEAIYELIKGLSDGDR